MLPKKYRLKKNKDFEAVFKKGKVLQNNFFFIKFLENKEDFNRFGIIISSKVSKKAVERNRVKRQIWALIREKKDIFKKRFDVVIIVKKPALNVNKGELKNSLALLLEKCL